MPRISRGPRSSSRPPTGASPARLIAFGIPVLFAVGAVNSCSTDDGTGETTTTTTGTLPPGSAGTNGPVSGQGAMPGAPGSNNGPTPVGPTPAGVGGNAPAPMPTSQNGPNPQPGVDPTIPGPGITTPPSPTDPTPTGNAGGGPVDEPEPSVPGGGTAGQPPAAAGTGGGGTSNAGSGGSGAQGPFTGPRTPPPLGSWPPPGIQLTQYVSGGMFEPTAIAAPRGDNSRLYFAEKWGVVRLIKDGQLLSEPALDIRDEVLEGGPQGTEGHGTEVVHGGKRGLVGLAFDPNYETNGRVFVLYVADQGIAGYGTVNYDNVFDDGDMTVAQYTRSAGNPDTFNPASAEIILQFDKGNCNQCSQHNGGSLEVGVDGFLWASTGDPPPYEDPGSQDLNNLNGKLLRFDISGAEVQPGGNYPGADPYVWSVGIRNAYKFSIDRYTGDIYVGDVGENDWEEITVERYGDGHKNHEFPMLEGTAGLFDDSCDDENCLAPVFEYGHTGSEGTPGADNCIIGGYVYRGAAIPALQGTYLFSDYGSGKLRGLQVENGALLNGSNPVHEFSNISIFAGCFGEDAAGEMYVCDYDQDRILRVDAQ